MGFLSRAKDKGKHEQAAEEVPTTCPHTSLVQRWDQPEEIGDKEKAHYICDACGEAFSYEQAQGFLEHPSVPALEHTPR